MTDELTIELRLEHIAVLIYPWRWSSIKNRRGRMYDAEFLGPDIVSNDYLSAVLLNQDVPGLGIIRGIERFSVAKQIPGTKMGIFIVPPR